MKSANLDTNVFVLRLDRGDGINESIAAFALEKGIANASVQGIGSIEEPTLAHYSIETKQFTEAHFEGIYEVTSLLGNIALVNNQPTPHLHVTISDIEMETHGGHLKAGAASATLEVIVTAYASHLSKQMQNEVGLNIWDI